MLVGGSRKPGSIPCKPRFPRAGWVSTEAKKDQGGLRPPRGHPECYPEAIWWPTGRHPEATLRLPRGYPEATPRLRLGSRARDRSGRRLACGTKSAVSDYRAPRDTHRWGGSPERICGLTLCSHKRFTSSPSPRADHPSHHSRSPPASRPHSNAAALLPGWLFHPFEGRPRSPT